MEATPPPTQVLAPLAQAGWQKSCWDVPLCRQLSLPVRDLPHSLAGPLPSLHSLTCVGQGRGWEGQQALKGKLLKPLGQEVAEGLFPLAEQGCGEGWPCLLPVCRGLWEPRRAESPSLPLPTPTAAVEAPGPLRWGFLLRGGCLHFAGRRIQREG